MILKEGIAGFYHVSERECLPHVDLEKFKREISGSLAQLGYKLLYVREAGVTPNFHLAVFEKLGDRFGVICNSIYPVVALVEELEEGVCELRYVEHAAAKSLIDSYTSFECISSDELARELTTDALKELNSVELSQVRYWKPQTIGEVVFNWWD